jgi:adenylosuccinate synthase
VIVPQSYSYGRNLISDSESEQGSFLESLPSSLTLYQSDYDALRQVRFTRSIRHTIKGLARDCKDRLEMFKLKQLEANHKIESAFQELIELINISKNLMKRKNEDLFNAVKKTTAEMLDYLKYVYTMLREEVDEEPEEVFTETIQDDSVLPPTPKSQTVD